jgi:DNA-directed RNA polymerase subunit E'/Rpb7
MTIIEKRLMLEPIYLDSNIMTHFKNLLEKNVIGECTEEYGHILSIKRIIEITNNESTIFKVIFDAETLKPEAGKNIKGKVCMLYKDGIFLKAGNQKLLIPVLNLNGYKFDEVEQIYTKDNETIQEGQEIEACVTAVKYSNNNFSCFGSLVVE